MRNLFSPKTQKRLARISTAYLMISMLFSASGLGNFVSANHDAGGGGTPYDTGWISASQFSGPGAVIECGNPIGLVWGQIGSYFWIEPSVLNLPAGDYSIDIKAHYGFYASDPQAPQTNETMRVYTQSDSRTISDLNGDGGQREDRDDCDQIKANIKIYTNITGTPLSYNGQGSLFFEGLTGDSQSIEIIKVRVHGISAPPPPPPPPPPETCVPSDLIAPQNGHLFGAQDNNPTFQWQAT
ncbi:MAG: hypothetical protein HYT68_01330, partial [Candidatus Zambryskibacteria bacterium]|nr:hypothetical protein [Candidatus Zambryskibacteria bacterium]